MMKLEPYSEYQVSGLPWVGKIPAHWRVLRNGGLFAHRVETGYPDLPILEVSLRTGVTIRDFGNTKRKQVMSQREKYKRARRGDIAYNMMRMWQGAVGVAPVDGLVSPAYVVVQPYAGTDTRYFNYLFGTQAYKAEVNKYSRGIVADRNRLYWDGFKQMSSIVPSTDEQSKITAFLRAQDHQIAKLIRSKRRLIELLNEQRQTIIHRAITRGLNPDVPLKPSGVDWLGDVPVHWNLSRLKNLARLRSGDSITSFQIEESGEFPVYGGNGLRGYTNSYTHEGEYVLIGWQGALCGNINYAKGKFWASEHAVVANPLTKYNLRWFGELLRAMNLNQYSQSAAQPGLAVERIKNLCAPVPPIDEQDTIVRFFETETASLDITINATEHEIALIREYRDRLISDVVTGQIDVRDWQPEPDDENDADILATLSEADENGESLDDEEVSDV